MFESDDGTVSDKSATHEWGKFFIEGGKKIGQTFLILENDLQEKGMEEAGFVDITAVDKKVIPAPYCSDAVTTDSPSVDTRWGVAKRPKEARNRAICSICS